MQTLKVLLGDRKTFTKVSSPGSIGPSTKIRPVYAFRTQQSCHSVFMSPVDTNASGIRMVRNGMVRNGTVILWDMVHCDLRVLFCFV